MKKPTLQIKPFVICHLLQMSKITFSQIMF